MKNSISSQIRPVYQVIACSLDYSKCLSVYCSDELEQCISVATALYRNSMLVVYKIVDVQDNVVVSYLRQPFKAKEDISV